MKNEPKRAPLAKQAAEKDDTTAEFEAGTARSHNRMNYRLKMYSAAACLLAVTACSLPAESLSFTGTLSSPESVFDETFTLSSADTVSFQTWGFGGGINAAGQVIPAGGFDPLIALFSGPPATAMMYVDGSGNPLADADNLANPLPGPLWATARPPGRWPSGRTTIAAMILCRLRWARELTPWCSPTPTTYRTRFTTTALSLKASWISRAVSFRPAIRTGAASRRTAIMRWTFYPRNRTSRAPLNHRLCLYWWSVCRRWLAQSY
jgi:hypothetical protein